MTEPAQRKIAFPKAASSKAADSTPAARLAQLKTPLVALALGVAVAALIIMVTSKAPLAALQKFFLGPFSGNYYFGRMLNTTGLLLTAAMGAALAMEGGYLNLGGEGQVYLGGFLTALILNAVLPEVTATAHPGAARVLAPAVLVLTAATVSAATSLLTMVPYLLERFRNVPVLLSSFLLSQAVIPLVDNAVSGRFRDTTGNLLSLPAIATPLRFPQLLKPSLFNASFFVVLALYTVYYPLLYRTRKGQELRITGRALEFARYTGLDTHRLHGVALALSGAMHGLTGFFAVTGAYYTCHAGFYSGFGWNALTAALIAAKTPELLAPATLILAYLFTASDKAVLTSSLNFDLTYTLQAVLLFFITATTVAPPALAATRKTKATKNTTTSLAQSSSRAARKTEAADNPKTARKSRATQKGTNSSAQSSAARKTKTADNPKTARKSSPRPPRKGGRQ